MKKILLTVSAFTLALGLAACSSNNSGSTEKKSTTGTETAKADLKKPMVKFFMNLSKKINAKDADLNTYENAEQPTPEMKPAASASAAAVAEEIKTIKVPAELKSKQADIESALKDFVDSYQAKAEELKKDAPSMDAANATFTQGEDKLGKVFLSVKLLKPSLNKEVNG